VPWNPRVTDPRPETLFDHHVTVANATRLDFNPNLSGPGIRDVALNNLPVPVRFTDLCGSHALHRNAPLAAP
jgi:hypothetical protein